jgi:hypothetical protein
MSRVTLTASMLASRSLRNVARALTFNAVPGQRTVYSAAWSGWGSSARSSTRPTLARAVNKVRALRGKPMILVLDRRVIVTSAKVRDVRSALQGGPALTTATLAAQAAGGVFGSHSDVTMALERARQDRRYQRAPRPVALSAYMLRGAREALRA